MDARAHTQTRTRMHTHTDTTEYTQVAYRGNLQFMWSQCSHGLNRSQLNWVLTIPVKPVLTEWVPTELGAHTRSVTAALVPLTTNSSVALLSAHTGPRPDYCVLTPVPGLTTVCSHWSNAWLLCAHTGPVPDYCVLTLVQCLTTVCSHWSNAWLLCAHTGPMPDYCVLTLVQCLTTVCTQQL